MPNFRPGPDRRAFLGLSGALALAASVLPVRAQNAPSSGDKASVDLLMAPQALPDVWMGDPKAPVTMIEYASMTCSHCADWENHVFPILKSKYIDTGKVRYTMREFPLDPLAAAGFMLARCSDNRQAMIELLFAKQKDWAFVKDPLDALRDLVKQTGMNAKDFDACLNNQKMFDKVNDVRDEAAKKFGVNATPTFFINGDKKPGEIPPDQLDAVLAPYLKK